MKFSSVQFQVDPASVPSLASWMEEVAAVAHILTQTGIISAIEEQVQFARARFGRYDTIDFVIVLLSYAPLVENPRSRHFMSVWPLFGTRWRHCFIATTSPRVSPFPAFWPR